VRVHSLAKELGKTSKELIQFLKTQGINVKSHMSAVPQMVAQILRDRYQATAPKPAPKAKKPETEKVGAGADKNGAGRTEKRWGPDRAPNAGPAWDTSRDSRRGPAGGGPAGGGPAGGGPAGGGGGGDRGGGGGGGRGKGRKIFFPSNEYNAGQRAGVRRRPQGRGPGGPRRAEAAKVEIPSHVEVEPPVNLKDLSSALGVKTGHLMKAMMGLGRRATLNQFLDNELVEELCMELGTEVTFKNKDDSVEEVLQGLEELEFEGAEQIIRAPVVTFLGHVDHGKTSLLDKIRETAVTAKEHGGITQHLGAYRVDKGDVHVTFIDTPGHKAFTEMRARGANATDVAVLIVAADDGPMPQTEEAINHARAANVPIVVAINKCDLPAANPQRVKEQLSGLGLQPVEWSGDTECIEVSAHTGQGIDSLLEVLSLESEILELKATPSRPALGVVLEAEATTTRGVLATVLVKDGTLKAGDYVLAGASHGRVRNLIVNGVDDIDEAGPSMPVTLVGLNSAPSAGEKFYVIENEKQAKSMADERERRYRELEQAEKYAVKKASLEDLVKRMGDSDFKELKLIIKADVQGSIEALRTSLVGLSTDEIEVVVLHTGVGAVTQEDVNLAAASEAVIIGFHVVADDRARSLADEQGIDIRHYKVIYEAVEEVKAAMEERLSPEEFEVVHGRAEIRQVFRASKIGNIAGCFMKSGYILRNDKVRLIRDGAVIYEGTLSTLKRFKDDVKEVKEGFECGIKISGYEDIKEGDEIESYAIEHKARKLDQ